MEAFFRPKIAKKSAKNGRTARDGLDRKKSKKSKMKKYELYVEISAKKWPKFGKKGAYSS